MKIKTPSFADLFAETSPQLGGTRRTKFLETLDRLIPWQDLKSLIGPYYSKGKQGAQPYPLELMIRIHFLQLVYNLSDPMCEETLHDSFACRRFVGLTMDSKCPDETTILRFRHLLEKNGLDKQVLNCLNSSLPPEVSSSARAQLLTALLLKRQVRRKTLTKNEILKCARPRKATTGTSE